MSRQTGPYLELTWGSDTHQVSEWSGPTIAFAFDQFFGIRPPKRGGGVEVCIILGRLIPEDPKVVMKVLKDRSLTWEQVGAGTKYLGTLHGYQLQARFFPGEQREARASSRSERAPQRRSSKRYTTQSR